MIRHAKNPRNPERPSAYDDMVRSSAPVGSDSSSNMSSNSAHDTASAYGDQMSFMFDDDTLLTSIIEEELPSADAAQSAGNTSYTGIDTSSVDHSYNVGDDFAGANASANPTSNVAANDRTSHEFDSMEDAQSDPDFDILEDAQTDPDFEVYEAPKKLKFTVPGLQSLMNRRRSESAARHDRIRKTLDDSEIRRLEDESSDADETDFDMEEELVPPRRIGSEDNADSYSDSRNDHPDEGNPALTGRSPEELAAIEELRAALRAGRSNDSGATVTGPDIPVSGIFKPAAPPTASRVRNRTQRTTTSADRSAVNHRKGNPQAHDLDRASSTRTEVRSDRRHSSTRGTSKLADNHNYRSAREVQPRLLYKDAPAAKTTAEASRVANTASVATPASASAGSRTHASSASAATTSAAASAARTSAAPARPARRRISAKKRRALLDNKLSLWMSLAFFAFMLLIAIILIVVPRSKVSEIERRSLATFPQFSFANYFSGDFTSGVTEFYDDTVPARDSLKNVGNNLKSLFGVTSANAVEVIGNVTRVNDTGSNTTGTDTDLINTEADADVTNTDDADADGGTGIAGDAEADADTTADADAADDSLSEEQINSKDYRAANADATMEDGILVVYQDGHWRALALYGGVYDTMYSDTVNYIRQVVGSDVNIYFMPVPLAAQFYLPANYEGYSADQETVYQEASSYMMSGVKCIDIIEAENNHNEEAIYLRTDHHWAPLGAYYAARQFAEAADVPFADLSTYTRYVNEGYVGTMYAYTGSANILNDPEDFVYYVPTNNYTVDYYDREFNYRWTAGLFFDTLVSDSYSMVMGGDDQIVKVTTDAGNGRRLLVVKDSYGNAEIPFLTHSFEEIYVVDQRYFEVNLVNFILYNAITDILFTHNYMSLAGPETELLDYITYSYVDVPIYDDAPEAVLPDRSNNTTEDTEES